MSKYMVNPETYKRKKMTQFSFQLGKKDAPSTDDMIIQMNNIVE